MRKPTPWGLIIGILLAGFVLVAGVCALAGYMFYKTASSNPVARKGFGKPTVVAYLDDGWARYRFAEVPMTVELPGEPEADRLQFESGSNLFTASWIYYGIYSELNTLELVGQWYRDKELVDLDDETTYAGDWAKYAQDAKNVKFDASEATIGGMKGREVRGTCTVDGDSMVFRFFYFSQGDAVFVVHSYAWADSSKDAGKEYERIVKSIQMK